MIPDFDINGNLPEGIHDATWQQITERYGYTIHRRKLLKGLLDALHILKKGSCKIVYLDGSFITNKVRPKDYDCCFEKFEYIETDFWLLHREFFTLNLNPPRDLQKKLYFGEFMPAKTNTEVKGNEMLFLDLLQQDIRTGVLIKKGIIKINLDLL